MQPHEADQLRAHLNGLRRAAWDLECACPGRRELDALAERMDDLERWLEERHDPAADERDL
jgi:hypothetical protein